MIKANEATKRASDYHEKQRKHWYEAMKSFADNELSNLIAAAANNGKYSVKFELPKCVAYLTLKEYLNDNGYDVVQDGNVYQVSWDIT